MNNYTIIFNLITIAGARGNESDKEKKKFEIQRETDVDAVCFACTQAQELECRYTNPDKPTFTKVGIEISRDGVPINPRGVYLANTNLINSMLSRQNPQIEISPSRTTSYSTKIVRI